MPNYVDVVAKGCESENEVQHQQYIIHRSPGYLGENYDKIQQSFEVRNEIQTRRRELSEGKRRCKSQRRSIKVNGERGQRRREMMQERNRPVQQRESKVKLKR